MSKTLKRFLVILIVLVGTIAVIPKLEQASVNMKDSDYIYGCNPNRVGDFTESVVKKTLGQLKNGEPIFVVDPWIVNNYNVLCIQERQHLTDGQWKITQKVEINSNSGNWAQGLAYLLDKASIGVDSSNNQYAWKEDNVQKAIWSYLAKTKRDAMQFFSGISMDSNLDHSNDNSSVKDLVDEAMSYYSGQKFGAFKATFYIMRYIDGSEDDCQALIIIEKTEPDTPKFQFDINKVDDQGKSVSGAKFDVTITGIKNVTVDGTNYSSYSRNITVNGTQSFTSIEPDPNADCITVTVKETEAPSKLYEIDENTYIKKFRYYEGQWQSYENDTWTKCNSSFTLRVKNDHKLEGPKPKIETLTPKIDGYAWLDEQQGDKVAQIGDGIYRK